MIASAATSQNQKERKKERKKEEDTHLRYLLVTRLVGRGEGSENR
jgi:hypothetical protein